LLLPESNSDASEESIPVFDIQKGDRLLIRNQELIPVDGILISEEASEIDYSFVTGEADSNVLEAIGR
jgi:Cu+-exporting ATPase